MRFRSAFHATLAVAIAVSACDRSPGDGSDSAEAPTFTAWDSGGIEIFENQGHLIEAPEKADQAIADATKEAGTGLAHWRPSALG